MLCTIPEQEQFIQQLTTMVLTDSLPSEAPVPPAYLFTQTKGNQSSVLIKGAELLKTGIADHLLILDDLEKSNLGYPGAGSWLLEIQKLGVNTNSDVWTIGCRQPLNTFSESLALAGYAIRTGAKQLIIIAPPFHMVRAFISVVSAIRKLEITDLKIYCQVGLTLPWNGQTAHSQGTLVATRQKLILTELERIYLYREKGDLVSTCEALWYLEWRNS